MSLGAISQANRVNLDTGISTIDVEQPYERSNYLCSEDSATPLVVLQQSLDIVPERGMGSLLEQSHGHDQVEQWYCCGGLEMVISL